jgi:hypothetical protein
MLLETKLILNIVIENLNFLLFEVFLNGTTKTI